MRSSFNALWNKKPHADFLTTTVGLLCLSFYMGVAFKDIAVIKMIKGATLGVSIMFIFPALIYLQLSGPMRMQKKSSGEALDGNSLRRRERRTKFLRIMATLLMLT